MTPPLCRCGFPAVACLSRIFGRRRIGENMCATCYGAELRLASGTANLVTGALMRDPECPSSRRTEAATRAIGNGSSRIFASAPETDVRGHRPIRIAEPRTGSRIP